MVRKAFALYVELIVICVFNEDIHFNKLVGYESLSIVMVIVIMKGTAL